VILPPGRWVDWWTGAVTNGDGHTSITVPAPLDTLPLWRNAERYIPIFARDADTLLPATASGVTSYGDSEELRWVATPTDKPVDMVSNSPTTGPGGGLVSYGMTDGSYEIPTLPVEMSTFDLDARGATVASVKSPTSVTAYDNATHAATVLPSVADENALRACAAPGCWLWEPTAERLRIRAANATILVR
jgi:hypothetical protein